MNVKTLKRTVDSSARSVETLINEEARAILITDYEMVQNY